METYRGSCHCGTVRYTVEADIQEAMSCNCSHCVRKGFLLTFVPESQFHLISGEDNLTTYKFNKKHIAHLFCKTCGVQSFARGHDSEGKVMIGININCLEDFDTINLSISKFDGKST